MNAQTLGFARCIKRNLKGALLAAALGVTASSPAFADDCSPYIGRLFSFDQDYWRVQAVSMTSRGSVGGFSSYSDARRPGELPWRPNVVLTYLNPATGAIEVRFEARFPGSVDSLRSDQTTLIVEPSGRVMLRLDAWGGVSVDFGATIECFPGHQGDAFVLTGRARTSSHGLDVWTVLFEPDVLI